MGSCSLSKVTWQHCTLHKPQDCCTPLPGQKPAAVSVTRIACTTHSDAASSAAVSSRPQHNPAIQTGYRCEASSLLLIIVQQELLRPKGVSLF